MTTAPTPTASDVAETPEAVSPPSSSKSGDGVTSLHEAMLDAIGELSDEDRERLGSAEQPDDVARAWRDLIAERAAREREDTVRTELTREFESQTHASQPRPTAGLRGHAPTPTPASVAEWTDHIRDAQDESQRQHRRSQFANWLSDNPGA